MGSTQSKRSIYCVSDLHTDHDENWTIIQKLKDRSTDFEEVNIKEKKKKKKTFKQIVIYNFISSVFIEWIIF